MVDGGGTDLGFGVEPGLEVGRQRAVERDSFTRGRVPELEFGGVEERAFQSEVRSSLSVRRVAEQRMVDGRQVDPDLMRPARLETTLEA